MADDTSPLRKTSKALHTLADEIDNHQKNLDVAKLSFSMTGAAGGIMTIAGLFLFPGPAIAGRIVGGMSAAGNICSLVADKVLTSTTIRNAQEELEALAVKVKSVENKLSELIAKLTEEEKHYLLQWLPNFKTEQQLMDVLQTISKENYKELLECVATNIRRAKKHEYVLMHLGRFINMANSLRKWREAMKALDVLTKGAGAAAKVASSGKAANAAKAAKTAKTADAGSDTIKTARKTVSRARNVSVAFAGLGLAFDLGAIVYYSMKVNKMEPCTVAENIREVARRLE